MATIIKDFDLIKADFVSYLRARIEEYGGPNVSDYNVGSVVDVLSSAFSDVLEDFYFSLFQIQKEALENIYNGFNFYRLPAKKALCKAYVYIDVTEKSLLSINYFNIPKGTKFSTEDGTIEFEVLSEYDNNKLEIASTGEFVGKVVYSSLCTSVNTGSTNNISSNKLTKIATDILNINGYSLYVRNDSASGGTDGESEEDMKARFQKYLLSLRRGTAEAIEYALSSSVSFAGLLYSINKYRPLYVLEQDDDLVGTSTYLDLSYANKFDEYYDLCNDAYTSSPSNPFAIYIGSDEKFYNVLFSTQSIPASGSYTIESIEYFNYDTETWQDVTSANITMPFTFVTDTYVSFTLDSTKWKKNQVKDYYAYFIRVQFKKSTSPIDSVSTYKTMTYPFPGYLEIYCLKNYRDPITDIDKQLITEAVERFKAAGVITIVSSASIVNLYPTIIIHSPPSEILYLPEDLEDSIRTDVVEYANNLDISKSFDRNDFYSYIYTRYSQYGTIYIYYKYDNSININQTLNLYKEGFRDVIFDSSVSEKADLNFSDIYILSNLNALQVTTTGEESTGASPAGTSGDLDADFYGAY